MFLSGIKKILSPFAGKRKRGNNYLHSEMNPHALLGQGSHQTDKYKQLKNRLARFLRALSVKKQAGQGYHGYKTPAGKGKMIFKVAGFATIMFSLLLFIMVGGGRVMVNNFQSLAFFRVAEIVISGNHSVPEEKLREALGIIPYQTSLIGLNCSQLEARLANVPWVARAEVQRNWPSTVEVFITENVPVALLHSKNQGGAQLQYIDWKGVPFLQVMPGADIDFPVITGLTEIEEPLVREKALAEVLVFLKKVNGNDPYLPAQSVSEIHVTGKGEMVVYLVDHPFPIFFGESNTGKKYFRLVQVLRALYKKQNGKESISKIEYIQMDYLKDKVLVAQSD